MHIANKTHEYSRGETLPGDQYNATWDIACINGGHTEKECNDIMSRV